MSIQNLAISTLGLFLLRVAIIIWGGQLEAPGGDQLAFYSGAQQLTSSLSEWVKEQREFGYRAPLYFVYLATVLGLTPHATFMTAQIATTFLGVLNCVLMFVLIRNMTNERCGRFGFWLKGLLPPFVFADTFVMSEPLFATFLLSILTTISLRPYQPTKRQALILGSLVGCALLTREVAVLYPVIFGGYLLLASSSGTDAARNVALFAAALLITLTPWMYRNVLVWGQPLPLSYTSGANLYIGNNPDANGKWMQPAKGPEDASLGFGTPQSDTWHRKEAIKHILEDPLRFIRLGFKKVAWFLWPRFEREEIKNVYKVPAREATLLSCLLGVSSAALILVGTAGLVLAVRGWFWWISICLISYTMLVTFCVYGSPRYRDAIDYLLLAFAVDVITRWPLLWTELKMEGSSAHRKILVLASIYTYFLINWIWISFDLTSSG